MSSILTIEEYQSKTKAKLIKGRNENIFEDNNIVVEEIEDFFYIADINNINHIICDYSYYDKEEYPNINETRPFALFLSFILNNFVYVVLVKDSWLEIDEDKEELYKNAKEEPLSEKEIIYTELKLLLKELSVDENFMINGTNRQYRSKIARDMLDENKDRYPLLSNQSKRKEYIDFQYEIDTLYQEERLHYRKI